MSRADGRGNSNSRAPLHPVTWCSSASIIPWSFRAIEFFFHRFVCKHGLRSSPTRSTQAPRMLSCGWRNREGWEFSSGEGGCWSKRVLLGNRFHRSGSGKHPSAGLGSAAASILAEEYCSARADDPETGSIPHLRMRLLSQDPFQTAWPSCGPICSAPGATMRRGGPFERWRLGGSWDGCSAWRNHLFSAMTHGTCEATRCPF